MNYDDFVRGKLRLALPAGIANPGKVSDMLFPFQREAVRWALSALALATSAPPSPTPLARS